MAEKSLVNDVAVTFADVPPPLVVVVDAVFELLQAAATMPPTTMRATAANQWDLRLNTVVSCLCGPHLGSDDGEPRHPTAEQPSPDGPTLPSSFVTCP
jgi:hypothetical protein